MNNKRVRFLELMGSLGLTNPKRWELMFRQVSA